MKVYLKHFANVHNGKLVLFNPQLYNASLLEIEGKSVEVIIKERNRKATMSQHNFYRGVILEACYLSETFSYMDKKDDIHDDYFAPKFLSYVKMVIYPDGSKKEVIRYQSMAGLTVKETTDFIEKVMADCALNGIYIGDPATHYNQLYKK